MPKVTTILAFVSESPLAGGFHCFEFVSTRKAPDGLRDGQGTTTLDGISALDAWLSLLVSALPLDHISGSQ